MVQWRRFASTAVVVALVAGTSAAVGTSSAVAAENAGPVFSWDSTGAQSRFPVEGGPQGPWAKLADTGSVTANLVPAIRPDGTVDALLGRAGLTAIPASVLADNVLSVSVGGSGAVWAVTDEGVLHKWGGSRGSIPDHAFDTAELGGKAVAVSGTLSLAYVVVEPAEGPTVLKRVDAYGVEDIVRFDDDAQLTGVVGLGQVWMDNLAKDNQVIALRDDGSVAWLNYATGWQTVVDNSDPVIAIGGSSRGAMVTSGGDALGYLVSASASGGPSGDVPPRIQVWEDTAYPGVPAGQSVVEVQSVGANKAMARTDAGRIVAWNARLDGNDTASPFPMVELPATVRGSTVLDLASENDGSATIRAILANENAHDELEVATPSSIDISAPVVGQTLTGTPAVIEGDPVSVRYQWFADGAVIPGATGATLEVTEAQLGRRITFQTFAMYDQSDVVYSESARTEPVTSALGTLDNVTPPVISGTAKVGQTLSVTVGEWDPEPDEFDYGWYRDGNIVTNAETYTLTSADLGKRITARVYAYKAGYVYVTADSAPTDPVIADLPALEATSKPTIAGTAQVSRTLTGTPAVFNDTSAGVTVTNQWLADGQAIGGANGTTLALTAAQEGKRITFASTAVRGGETVVSTSDESAEVAPAPAAPVGSTTRISAPARVYGSAGVVTVTVGASKSATGSVTLSGAGATQVRGLSGGKATFVLPRALGAGRYTLRATFTSTSAEVSGSGTSAAFTVVKGATKRPAIKITKKSTSKKKGKATVTVAQPSGLAYATGKAQVLLQKGKSKKVVTVSLSRGKRTATLPKLKKGTWKVRVLYRGNGNYKAQYSKTYKLKVK